jgi:hypothetical protein
VFGRCDFENGFVEIALEGRGCGAAGGAGVGFGSFDRKVLAESEGGEAM